MSIFCVYDAVQDMKYLDMVIAGKNPFPLTLFHVNYRP